jgi:hypothetical protein
MTGNSIDREAIAENIQRTVRLTALRKVRALVEDLQAKDRRQDVLQRCLLVLAPVLLIAWVAFFVSQRAELYWRDSIREAQSTCETRLYPEYLAEYRLYLERALPASSPEEREAALRAREAYVLKQVLAECRKRRAK